MTSLSVTSAASALSSLSSNPSQSPQPRVSITRTETPIRKNKKKKNNEPPLDMIVDALHCNDMDTVAYSMYKSAMIQIEAALVLMEKSAECGNANAMDVLARCYTNGIGVEEDPERAHLMYQEAAESGFTECWYNVGFNYDEQYQENRDNKLRAEARKYMDLAMDAYQRLLHHHPDHVQGNNNLGILYWNKRMHKKAADCFKKAANEIGQSALYLGKSYDLGLGVHQNTSNARVFYKMAKELGEEKAIIYLDLLPKDQ